MKTPTKIELRAIPKGQKIEEDPFFDKLK